MKSIDFVNFFKNHKIAVFSIKDAIRIINKSGKYVSLFLSKNKAVVRIERGKYYIKGSDPYEIASNIIAPCYVSAVSAFRYYNQITQMPNLIEIISAKQHKELQFEGFKVKFIKTDKEKLFGYVHEDGVYIAEIEKAVIDSLYFRNNFYYIKEAMQNGIDKINLKKMKEYAKKMNSKILINKLGFLLDSLKLDSKDLEKQKSRAISRVSITATKFDKKWRIFYD